MADNGVSGNSFNGLPVDDAPGMSDSSFDEEMLDMEIEAVHTLENVEVNQRPGKRGREKEEEKEEWSDGGNQEKKIKPRSEGEIEIYVSSNEKMPKQFSLAKLFMSAGVTDIQGIKYLNPYKIRVNLINEESAVNLEKCEMFKDKGWRVQRALEVNLSYGLIRDVDLNMSEQDILKCIKCPSGTQISAAYRLKRRSTDNEWTSSESVRLTFIGSFRPSYIVVDGLRIRVEPYKFPVSQCSRCWRFGHTAKKCPHTKFVCPKCGDNHQNCETLQYKCINCNGQHMALVRTCPAFRKEKRLRELMAEFNCTYRRALTLYVPPTSPEKYFYRDENTMSAQFPSIPHPTRAEITPQPKEDLTSTASTLSRGRSFAEVVTNAIIHTDIINSNKKTYSSSNKQRRKQGWSELETIVDAEPPLDRGGENPKEDDDKKAREVKFSELLGRLKDILFLKKISMGEKVKIMIRSCIEWVILVVTENISDWPILKIVLDYVQS